ncbi:MAG: tetratricopeptide repeat protein, partial [Flammeovirgaceae bacterium]|nr:tetratricopeptide repeat protein [Flammeovirgaceae bacterium]
MVCFPFLRQLTIFLIFILGNLLSAVCYAQLDELNKKLQNTQNEAEKPILLNKIAEEEILKNDFEASLKHAQEAVALAQKYKLDEQEMYGNLNISKYYKYKRQFATALDYALKALRISEKKGTKYDRYVCLTEIAFIYQDWSAYEKVIEYLEMALTVTREINDKQKETDVANLIGLSYLNIGKPKDALKYFVIIKDNLKSNPDQGAYVSALRRLTDIYQRVGDYENALKYNQEILEIKQKQNDLAGAATQLNYIGFLYKQLNRENEALKVFEDAVKLNRELNRPERDNTSLLINIGVINQNKGNLNKALSTFQEVLNIAKSSGEPSEIANAEKYIAATYISMGDFNNARKYIEDAISNAKKAGRTDILESSYKRLAQIHKLAGNTKKALEVFEEYVQLKDSLLEVEKRKQVEQLAKSAEAEKQENKLRLLQMDQEMQQLQLQNLQMEAKRKEQELELQAQRLSMLEQEKLLQETKLKQEQLEKDKIVQDLLLARQQLDAEQRAQEIDRLQKENELRELTLRQKEEEEIRRKKEMELLAAQKAMQEEKLKDEQQLRYAFYIIIALSITGLFSVFYGLMKNRQKNRILAAQNLEILKQKDEIASQRDEIERAYNNIQILNEFGQKITAKLNFEAINWTVYAYVNSFMDAAACGVGIYKPKDNVIEFKGFIDNGTTVPMFARNMNDGGSLAVWCLKNQKVIFINDFEAEKDKYLTDEFKIHGIRQKPESVICVPLKVEEKYIGVFMIWSFKKNAYEPKDLTILQTLASYISIALDNANAYEVIKAKNQSITDSIRY